MPLSKYNCNFLFPIRDVFCSLTAHTNFLKQMKISPYNFKKMRFNQKNTH